jgi:hypothetical protein
MQQRHPVNGTELKLLASWEEFDTTKLVLELC